MFRTIVGLLACSVFFVCAARSAEPFTIDFKVSAGTTSKTVHGEAVERAAKPKDREVLEVKADQALTVHWKVVHAKSKDTLKDVTIHFYAAPVEKISQASLAKLGRDVLAEAASNMDFTPDESNEGELHFKIHKAGLYLLRVESIGAAVGIGNHEEFAALIVKVP